MRMVYDFKNEGPRLTLVNGHDVFELPKGGFKVLTDDGVEGEFTTFDDAAAHAKSLPKGKKR